MGTNGTRCSDPINSTKSVMLVGSVDEEHNRLMKLCEAYKSAGWRVTVLGMDRYKKRQKRYTKDEIEFEYLVRGYGESNWTLLIGYSVWVACVVLRLLRARVDLVHVFEMESGLAVAITAALRKLVYIYDVQDNYELRHKWPLPVLALIRVIDHHVVQRAAWLIVPDTSRLTGVFSDFRDKAVIIPNCPPDDGCNGPREPSLVESVRVLAMGHLAERRGIRLLLQAAQELPGVKILVAGSFPRPELERETRACPSVEYLGWVNWKEAIGLGRRVDVIFTFYDPQYTVNRLANAQKWYDAMMSSTPVLVNREVLASKWLEAAGVAYVCEYSTAGIVSALQEIKRNKTEARLRGERARRMFESEFNWDNMSKRLLSAAEKAAFGAAGAQ